MVVPENFSPGKTNKCVPALIAIILQEQGIILNKTHKSRSYQNIQMKPFAHNDCSTAFFNLTRPTNAQSESFF